MHNSCTKKEAVKCQEKGRDQDLAKGKIRFGLSGLRVFLSGLSVKGKPPTRKP
jgi:hypothetical protein